MPVSYLLFSVEFALLLQLEEVYAYFVRSRCSSTNTIYI